MEYLYFGIPMLLLTGLGFFFYLRERKAIRNAAKEGFFFLAIGWIIFLVCLIYEAATGFGLEAAIRCLLGLIGLIGSLLFLGMEGVYIEATEKGIAKSVFFWKREYPFEDIYMRFLPAAVRLESISTGKFIWNVLATAKGMEGLVVKIKENENKHPAFLNHKMKPMRMLVVFGSLFLLASLFFLVFGIVAGLELVPGLTKEEGAGLTMGLSLGLFAFLFISGGGLVLYYLLNSIEIENGTLTIKRFLKKTIRLKLEGLTYAYEAFNIVVFDSNNLPVATILPNLFTNAGMLLTSIPNRGDLFKEKQ